MAEADAKLSLNSRLLGFYFCCGRLRLSTEAEAVPSLSISPSPHLPLVLTTSVQDRGRRRVLCGDWVVTGVGGGGGCGGVSRWCRRVQVVAGECR